MPEVMKRVKACKEARLKSIASDAKKLAETPTRFRDTMNPDSYLVIPGVSSERRDYIPIGFYTGDTIPVMGILIIPNATLYHFGILTSIVHMAWTRAVCGRLKSDYRYSKDIVYNNFPWPEPPPTPSKGGGVNPPLPPFKKGGVIKSPLRKGGVSSLAQSVLETRALFPNSSLADLYDPLTMPAELLKAHKELDRAVMKLYGFRVDMSETEIVSELMERYSEIITN